MYQVATDYGAFGAAARPDAALANSNTPMREVNTFASNSSSKLSSIRKPTVDAASGIDFKRYTLYEVQRYKSLDNITGN